MPVTTIEPPAKKATLILDGVDGNAFMILGSARKTARKAGYTPEQIEALTDEAKNGDYDHLLQTMFKWFEVE
jgi:hypothetical protein